MCKDLMNKECYDPLLGLAFVAEFIWGGGVSMYKNIYWYISELESLYKLQGLGVSGERQMD